jgi:hypothetical protein
MTTTRTRSWDTEVLIADKQYNKKKETGYVFNDGKRKFDDKVSKNKSYD